MSGSTAGSTTKTALTWQPSRKSKRLSAAESGLPQLSRRRQVTEGRGVWSRKLRHRSPCATRMSFLRTTQSFSSRTVAWLFAKVQICPPPSSYQHHRKRRPHLHPTAKGFPTPGGVATSALEMSQNPERLSWTFDEVDAKLHNIMINIHN